MGLGTISLEAHSGGKTLDPLFYDHIQFAGDDDYPAGGTPNFSTVVAAALEKEGINIVAVTKAGACGGYEVVYDKANDKLALYTYPDAAGVAAENTTTDLQAVTFDLMVIYN